MRNRRGVFATRARIRLSPFRPPVGCARMRSLARGGLGLTVVAGLLGAGLTAGPARAGSAAQTADSTSASRVPTKVRPHAVAPTVDEIAIPAVAAATARTVGGLRVGAQLTDPHTQDFRMVAVTWDHLSAPTSMKIQVRVLDAGTWSNWQRLEVDDDGPAATQEKSSVRDGTVPDWVDHATGVDVRVWVPVAAKAPTHMKVSAIDPGVSAFDSTIAADNRIWAGGQPLPGSPALTGQTPKALLQPKMITRKQWGVDPSLGDACWAPRYGRTIKMVFVHHTAESNNYTEKESASIVRGIYAYHTQSRAWCDIGYNFLVDRYGNVFQGRRGGIRKPVRGAHAGDYNVGSAGISLMGNFEHATPPPVMRRALVRLIAWRLGTSYRPARGWTEVYGSKFRRISGHRDAMATACPGQVVYDWLPTLRARVAKRIGDFHTAIYNKWMDEGGANGFLGLPFMGEHWQQGGWFTVFDHGRIYSKKPAGTHELHGAILAKYRRLGGIGSRLGFPTTDVWKTTAPGAVHASFQLGRIYSKPRTGTHWIYGSILSAWVKQGQSTGPLGLPTSDVYDVSVGKRQDFQHGTATWNATTKKTTVVYDS
jgi:hypothetical protein